MTSETDNSNQENVIIMVKHNPGCTASELSQLSEMDDELFHSLLLQAKYKNKIKREGQRFCKISRVKSDIWWPVE